MLTERSYLNLDRFGFVKSNSLLHSSNDAPKKEEISEHRARKIAQKENKRTDKWRIMLHRNEDIDRVVLTSEFSRRVRKGIPEALRGYIWINYLLKITDQDRSWAADILREAPKILSEKETGKDALQAISLDVPRTFPQHIFFQSSLGQSLLNSVLSGYASIDEEVGFCQGMSFVTAMLLMYASDVESLCILREIMTKPKWVMRELYKPGMPYVNLRLYQYERTLKRVLPDISKKFEALQFIPSMYAPSWFTTIFTYNFPFSLVVRVWDIFLFKGWSIVISVAVAFWKFHRKVILSLTTFESLYEKLRMLLAEFPSERVDEIIDDGYYISRKYASDEQLSELEKDFSASKA